MVTTMALGAIKDTTEPAIRGREATHKHVIVVSWMRRPGGEMEAGWVRRHGELAQPTICVRDAPRTDALIRQSLV